jgi:peroxiredoxin
MKTKSLLLALSLCALLALPAGATTSDTGGLVGAPAPDFEVTDLAGNKIVAGQIFGKGKVVLVNFWGLQCSACLDEMPHLVALKDKFKDRIEIYGVGTDGMPAEVVAAKMKKKNLNVNYVIIPDADFKLVDLFKMTVAPLTYVIDGKGIVRVRHENFEPGDEKKIDAEVTKLLEEK